jgi:integrin beta 3
MRETCDGKGDSCQEYRGFQTMTRKGLECQGWADFGEPHEPWEQYDLREFPDRLGPILKDNYCRNPDASREYTIWCYTTDPNTRFDYCDPI